MAFHRYLVDKSGHELLIRHWTEIVAQIAALLYLRAEEIKNYDEFQSIQDHKAIVKAYEQRSLDELKSLNGAINLRVAGECQRAVAGRERE